MMMMMVCVVMMTGQLSYQPTQLLPTGGGFLFHACVGGERAMGFNDDVLTLFAALPCTRGQTGGPHSFVSMLVRH